MITMLRNIAMKSTAFGLVLLGIVVGVAGAQVVDTFRRAGSGGSGLFTVSSGEAVSFHVSLDDDTPGPVGRVQMRLFDQRGVVVARQLVALAPGQSATLTHDVPGWYRAQADVLESAFGLSDRRTVASTVELFDVDDLKIKRIVCGENIPVRKD
jgi:hypothetical protein